MCIFLLDQPPHPSPRRVAVEVRLGISSGTQNPGRVTTLPAIEPPPVVAPRSVKVGIQIANEEGHGTHKLVQQGLPYQLLGHPLFLFLWKVAADGNECILFVECKFT